MIDFEKVEGLDFRVEKIGEQFNDPGVSWRPGRVAISGTIPNAIEEDLATPINIEITVPVSTDGTLTLLQFEVKTKRQALLLMEVVLNRLRQDAS